jgi:hypothetical protein
MCLFMDGSGGEDVPREGPGGDLERVWARGQWLGQKPMLMRTEKEQTGLERWAWEKGQGWVGLGGLTRELMTDKMSTEGADDQGPEGVGCEAISEKQPKRLCKQSSKKYGSKTRSSRDR